MKIVMTALVHQPLLKRKLFLIHWAALVIITLGCIIKTMDHGGKEGTVATEPGIFNYTLLLIQISASTVAGVYNEKLLKDRAEIPVNLQNCFLYVNGILFLTASFVCNPKEHTDALSPKNLSILLRQPDVLCMIIIMASVGVVTGRFLKVFDSVRKSIASALIVVSMPFLSALFFSKEGYLLHGLCHDLRVIWDVSLYSAWTPGFHDR